MEKINILGLNISNISKKTIVDELEESIKNNRSRLIVTPNPEIVLSALKDEELFYIINHAWLAIPDGFGLIVAGWVLGEKLTRVSGSDLTKDILKLAEAKGKKIAIINWAKGLSTKESIESVIKKYYPKLSFKVWDTERKENQPLKEINRYSPDVLFSTHGSPYQEKLLDNILKRISSIKISIGVGGSFDL